MNNQFQQSKRSLLVGLSLLSWIVTTQPVLSHSPSGRPSRQADGASRGDLCPQVKVPLTALVPLAEGKTLAPHPTFWFYIPYTEANASTQFTARNSQGKPVDTEGATPAEFILQDSENKTVGQAIPASLPSSPGVVGVRLPATISLEPNQSYRWFLNIYCNGRSQPPIAVEGDVQRVTHGSKTPKLATTVDPWQASDRYKTDGLWLDALNTLAEVRLKKPQDASLLEKWKDLLNQLQFQPSEVETMAAAPLTQSMLTEVPCKASSGCVINTRK